jgi:predicted nucleic acid-binding protein
MMMRDLIVDASILAAWLLPDEMGPNLNEIEAGHGRFRAPWILWAEFRNVMIAQERRNRIAPVELKEALEIFDNFNIIFDFSPSSQTVIGLAKTYRLSIYDSLYLELAIRTQSALASLDRKLIEAAKIEGVEIVG